MSKEINKPARFLQFLNNKGQGIVEFALVLAFCAGIGIAAREVGLTEALNAAFAGTSGAAEPSAIEAGKAEGTTRLEVTHTIDASAKVPEKTDAKYSSLTSDEAKDFNFVNDLKKYFEAHPTENDINDDIWNAYKGSQTFANAEAEAKARNVGLAMLGKDLTGDNAVEDSVWKDLKEANNWAFDTDDSTIKSFLNTYRTNTVGWDLDDADKLNAYIGDLQTRNVYFANLSTSDIEKMLRNLDKTNFANSEGTGSDFYDSYLAIKKQFWPNSVSLTLAPTIAQFTASSDEQRVFNYISGTNGLYNYFNGFSQLTTDEKLNKVLNAFNVNGVFAADAEKVTAVINANTITNVSDSFWNQIKASKGWVRDSDDEIIKTKLNDFITTIRNESENEMTDDEVIAELQARNMQFKNIGSSDASKATIKKMISNLSADTLDADVYAGYLAIKKQFWSSGDAVSLTLADKQGGGGSGILTEIHNNIQVTVANVSADGNFSEVITGRGDIFKYSGKYYVCTSYDIAHMNESNLSNNAVEINFDTLYTDSYAVNDGWVHFPYIAAGSIVLTGEDGREAWVVIDGGDYYTPPFSTGNQGHGKKIGTKIN